MKEVVETNWHITEENSSLGIGVRTGKLGSLTHIIDEENRAISDGYHKLYLTKDASVKGVSNRVLVSENVEIWGNRGAVTEKVEIKSYKDVKGKYKLIAETLEDTVQLLDARVVELEESQDSLMRRLSK